MTQSIPMVADTVAGIADTAEHATEPALLDHEYDGIREYDNPLPGWWRSIFIGTIVFAAFYALYFDVIGWGRSPSQAYQEALTRYQMAATSHTAGGVSASEDMLSRGAFDGGIVSRGKGVFVTKCNGCHGEDGRGIIGPNLTDNFQLHGTTRVDIFETIRDGVPGTPMPSWGSQLQGEDLIAVAVYATTLRGTNVPNGKPAQGNQVGAFAK